MSRAELIAEAKALTLYCDDPEWARIVTRLVASLEVLAAGEEDTANG